MRRVALVPHPDTEIRRLILYRATGDATYLFLSHDVDDQGSFADEWYESLADAEAECSARFRVERGMWTEVSDPEPGCQQDWIAPVRARGGAEGNPRGSALERRVDGVWIPLETRKK